KSAAGHVDCRCGRRDNGRGRAGTEVTMSSTGRSLTYANVMSTIAVFLAIGGGAYAVINLPANSVGKKQLRKNAVTSTKVKNFSLLENDFKAGELPEGAQGP